MITTIKDTLSSIIGNYTPSGSGIAAIDYEYIAAAVMFGICLYFCFSFIRCFFCGIMGKRW